MAGDQIKVVFFDVGNVLLYKEREPLEIIADKLGLSMAEVVEAQRRKDANPAIMRLYEAARTLEDQLRYSELSAREFLGELSLPSTAVNMRVVVHAWRNQERRLMPGARDIIEYLRPRYRLGIISNALPSRRTDELSAFELIEPFDPIVISAELGLQKPHPEIFHAALELAGVKGHEAAFVDDKPQFLDGAKIAGFGQLFWHDHPTGRYRSAYSRLRQLTDLKQYL